MKAILKEQTKEEEVGRMLKHIDTDTETKILNNSRLSVINSKYMPMFVGSLIISALYNAIANTFFTWIWIALSVATYLRRRNLIKKVEEMSE